MCVNSILCFLGVLYIINMIDKRFYKILPEINLGQFFNNKLGIGEISSLREYILTWINIYQGLKKIKIEDSDISTFDKIALNELKQFISTELRQYIKNTMFENVSVIRQESYIGFKLKNGKLDLHLNRNSISIKFESFSEDSPILEISNLQNTSYTYKFKNKSYRFVNPSIKTIDDIKYLIDEISLRSKSLILQAA